MKLRCISMLIISHRGNINGPDLEKENEPSYIDEAIRLGFDVEVDVRVINGKTWLGHDGPEYEVDVDWFFERSYNLLIHCKNLEAAYYFERVRPDIANLKCFCSISDPFCFVTQGYVWLNDVEVEPKDNCIVPLLNIDDIKRYKFMDKLCGVCTDYPMEIKCN